MTGVQTCALPISYIFNTLLFLIGGVGGVIVVLTVPMLDKFKIDDVEIGRASCRERV